MPAFQWRHHAASLLESAVVFGVSLLLPALARWQSVIRVAADAPAGGNGQSWATAYNDPATALSAANTGTEVWVEQGTYATTTGFVVPSGVEVYGGFAGSEESIDQRDYYARVTTLTASRLDTVVRLSNPAGTVVDGVRVVDGDTGPSYFSATRGGGFDIRGGTCEIRNCVIENCVAGRDRSVLAGASGGGAVYAHAGARVMVVRSILRNCRGSPSSLYTARNVSGDGGGALVVEYSDVSFVDCTFDSNHPGAGGGECAGGTFQRSADGLGGEVYVSSSALRVVRCIFVLNTAVDGIPGGPGCGGSPYGNAFPGGDGGVTIDDLLYYVGLFAAGAPQADVDDGTSTSTGTPDGGVTVGDLLYFLARYEIGC